MKKIEPSAIQVMFEDAGLEVRSYSGRYMYGKSCLGVCVDNMGQVFTAIAAHVDDENREEVQEALSTATTDAMGLGTIVYFPGTPYVDESDTCDEDENAA